MHSPSDVEVVLCKRCGAYKLGKRWHMHTLGGLIEKAVRETVLDAIRVVRHTESGIKLIRPTETEEVVVEVKPIVKKNLAEVRGMGKVHPLQAKPKSEEITVKFNLIYSTCDVCALKRARHYEAILQLRGLSSGVIEEIRKIIEIFAEDASARSPTDFIADIKEQRGGLDIYVSSLHLAKKMASLLKGKFRATVSESAKLIGQTREGRKKYRVSILVKF